MGMASTHMCKNGHGRLARDQLKQAHVCSVCGYTVSDKDVMRGLAGAGYGIIDDGVAAFLPGRTPAREGGTTLDGYVRKSLSHHGSRPTGMAAAQVLTGPSLGATLDSYVVPCVPVEPGGGVASRAELVGTLARFIAYLQRNGIMGDVDAPRGHHKLHKYAYIAKGLGMRLGYRFDFLENGAFSSDLEVDLFRMGMARGGAEPFGGDARRSAAFLELVRDKRAEWLQIATFAMRDRCKEGALEEFLSRRAGIIKYDRGMAKNAFMRVGRCVESISGGAP